MEETQTLADLLAEAIETRVREIKIDNSWNAGEFTISSAKESSQLALNCLEERFQSMIDERITQMLKELRP